MKKIISVIFSLVLMLSILAGCSKSAPSPTVSAHNTATYPIGAKTVSPAGTPDASASAPAETTTPEKAPTATSTAIKTAKPSATPTAKPKKTATVNVTPAATPTPEPTSVKVFGPQEPRDPSGVYSILFIGNSLIFYGSLPEQVRQLAGMYGIEVKTESITPGGAFLSDTKETAITRVGRNQYDYVVIQGEFFWEIGYLREICEAVRNSGAQPVLFHPALGVIEKELYEDKEAYQRDQSVYREVVRSEKMIWINSRDAWKYVPKRNYKLHTHLYDQQDGFHPSVVGTYYNACLIVSQLFEMHVKDTDEENIYKGKLALELGDYAWEYVSYYKKNGTFPTKAVTVPAGTNKKVN